MCAIVYCRRACDPLIHAVTKRLDRANGCPTIYRKAVNPCSLFTSFCLTLASLFKNI